MKNFICFALLLLITGCAGGLPSLENTSPPSYPDNYCKILGEKTDWPAALSKVKNKYGVPAHVVLAIMWQESRFVHDARPKAVKKKGLFGSPYASSAYGYSQALELTWAHYLDAADVNEGRRDSFEDSALFVGWYVDWASKDLNLKKWNAELLYLAYHEGLGGYKKKSYRKKPWLTAVAKKVGKRSELYRQQEMTCPDISNDNKNWFARYFL